MSFLTGAIRQAAAGTSQRAMMLGRTTAPLALRQCESCPDPFLPLLPLPMLTHMSRPILSP